MTQWKYAATTGTFSLDDGDVMNGVTFSLREVGDHGIEGRYEIQEESMLFSDDISHSTSILGERTSIEFETEIPIMLQLITSNDRIISKGIDCFGEPEKLAEEGYNEVYAATVLFSRIAP